MQSTERIINTYNATAESYAAARIDELSKKHLDRIILKEFALLNNNRGLCADLGCGPGHTTKFLYDAGMRDIIGLDISSRMITVAQRIFPSLTFKQCDLLALPFAAGHFSSAIAFYAIVHFDYEQVSNAFSEVNRVLANDGDFLFSFHVGEHVEHFDHTNGIDVDIDLHFFRTDQIIDLLRENNFNIINAFERLPYPEVEYPSKRGYIWSKKWAN